MVFSSRPPLPLFNNSKASRRASGFSNDIEANSTNVSSTIWYVFANAASTRVNFVAATSGLFNSLFLTLLRMPVLSSRSTPWDIMPTVELSGSPIWPPMRVILSQPARFRFADLSGTKFVLHRIALHEIAEASIPAAGARTDVHHHRSGNPGARYRRQHRHL